MESKEKIRQRTFNVDEMIIQLFQDKSIDITPARVHALEFVQANLNYWQTHQKELLKNEGLDLTEEIGELITINEEAKDGNWKPMSSYLIKCYDETEDNEKLVIGLTNLAESILPKKEKG